MARLPFCFCHTTSAIQRCLQHCVSFGRPKIVAIGLASLILASQSLVPVQAQETRLPFLNSAPELDYERNLLRHHSKRARAFASTYLDKTEYLQPANKNESCLIPTSFLDGGFSHKKAAFIYWEGECLRHHADGIGRVYIIKNNRLALEALAQFNSENPSFSTIYYYKDLQLDIKHSIFYGISTDKYRSGITINKSLIDDDLNVALVHEDKRHQITFKKTLARNSGYISNTIELTNYSHHIHDLQRSPYHSLEMAYSLENYETGHKLGYSFMGMNHGLIKGHYTNHFGEAKEVKIPDNILWHVISLNEEIELQLSNSLRHAIKAQEVARIYKDVICVDSYDSAVCRKMNCKSICNVRQTPVTDTPEVSVLLKPLIRHHKSRRLNCYLSDIVKKIDHRYDEIPYAEELLNSAQGLHGEKKAKPLLIPQD